MDIATAAVKVAHEATIREPDGTEIASATAEPERTQGRERRKPRRKHVTSNRSGRDRERKR
jgi:hypothetical protein